MRMNSKKGVELRARISRMMMTIVNKKMEKDRRRILSLPGGGMGGRPSQTSA